MKKLKCLAILISALTAAAVFSGCSDEKNNNGSVLYYDNSSNQYIAPDEKEQAARDNAQVVEGKIAEKASIGGFDINLKRVVYVGVREADAVNQTKSQLLAAEIEVTNNNSDTLEVSALGDFEVTIDGNETVQGLDSYAAVIAGKTIDGYKLLNYDVEAGQTVSGYMCFAVKENWQNIKITYEPDSKEISFDELYYTFTPDIVEKL